MLPLLPGLSEGISFSKGGGVCGVLRAGDGAPTFRDGASWLGKGEKLGAIDTASMESICKNDARTIDCDLDGTHKQLSGQRSGNTVSDTFARLVPSCLPE